MSDPELLYVSWGGNGAIAALRSAFEAALERSAPLLYLAILDEEHFGDLDASYLTLVVDELEWILDAQMTLIADQLDAEGHRTRILVRVGDVLDEIDDVVKASEVEAILVPSDVAESMNSILTRTGIEVEAVAP